MIYLVSDPVGIDIPIDRIQKFLYSGLNWDKMQMFGRIYKNQGDNGKLPQYNDGSPEYQKDVYISDKNNNANIFFVVNDVHKVVNPVEMESIIKIVFMVNLEKIYGPENQRLDSKAHKDVFDLLTQKNQFIITSLETGLETVLKDFDTSKIKKADLQPLHIFALVGKIRYNITKC